MFSIIEQAQKYISENNIRMLDVKWTGYSSRWHHVTLSARQFTDALMRDGIGFDSSAEGFKPVNAGDMVLIPDLATAFKDPFFDEPTLSLIANIHEADSKKQFAADPREVLRRALLFLKAKGIADECLWGPEFEFFVFDAVEFSNGLNHAGYRFYSCEANWDDGEQDSGYVVPSHGGYHCIQPADRHTQLRNQICIALQEVGIPVKYHHHEGGGPGHNEIEPALMTNAAAGDACMLIKYFVKNYAFQQGLTATFLPKPLYGEAGNGMHFHQLLQKDGRNIFYEAKGFSLMSQSGLYYIGGLLTHARALAAFTNPSTNSYRRLMPGYEAPVNCFFGKGDRSAAVRIPGYATDPAEVRLEYRPPDGTCNPYLAMAAMLLAGADGILNQIDPTKAGFGPFEKDVFNLPPQEPPVIQSLPVSLEEAVISLDKDSQFLLADEVFPAEFIDYWKAARTKDHYAVSGRPHPYEVELCFDV